MFSRITTVAFAALWMTLPATPADLPLSEFRARRAELMKRLPQGIVLLHATSDAVSQAAWRVHSFHQDPSFYYFSGQGSVLGAILAVDGPAQETWLFVPAKLSGLASMLPHATIMPGRHAAEKAGFDHVVDWDEFIPYIDRRLASQPSPALYVEDTEDWWSLRPLGPSIAESNPKGLAPIEDRWLLWRRAVEQRWPAATVRSAASIIQDMRLVKSAAELSIIRRLGAATTKAGLHALSFVRPGITEKEIALKVMEGCIQAGAEGPAFWPVLTSITEVEYYSNSRLRSKEIGRLDFGCDLDRYNSDVKRTIPLSGRFDAAQREVWTMFVAVYQAGLGAIRDGAKREDVFARAIGEAERWKSRMRTDMGRKAVDAVPKASRFWLLHSMGLECCEVEPDSLRAGMIVEFEPTLTVDGQEFSIEDMTLVTAGGHEVLSPVPYLADDLERAIRPGRKRSKP
ncbi:MAG TPA: aminopeptidase P N-terminal domain-containing protein [Bryobacteraceae bacterium]